MLGILRPWNHGSFTTRYQVRKGRCRLKNFSWNFKSICKCLWLILCIQEKVFRSFSGWCPGGYINSSTRPGIMLVDLRHCLMPKCFHQNADQQTFGYLYYFVTINSKADWHFIIKCELEETNTIVKFRELKFSLV
jgi:hypothetical protein